MPVLIPSTTAPAPYIIGIGTAAPETCYTQAQCWEALAAAPQVHQLTPRAQSLLRKVLHAENGIDTRCLALDPLADAFKLDPDTLHERFKQAAPALAAQAAERAMESAGLMARDIDGIVVSACTGYLCPGLSSYVSERLGLDPHVVNLDLVGHGCGAAAPTLRAGAGLLASGQARRVLCICVEVCSAAFYLDNDAGVLISACLFGDGAGAVILSQEPEGKPHGRTMQVAGVHGLLSHKDRDLLRFETRGGMLRNLLAKQVPFLVSGHASRTLAEAEARFGFSREEIQAWIVHAGGRDILFAIQNTFGLGEQDLRWSAQILKNHGNVSSASVFFVLEQALREQANPGLWWLTTFGAGMSCYGAPLRVE